MKDKIVLIVTALVFLGAAFLLGNKGQGVVVGSAPTGIPATVATTTQITLVAGIPYTLFGTTTGSGCSSRVISTQGAPLYLTFSDLVGQTPSAPFGIFQSSSTAVAYDSGLYGCGLIRASSSANQVITVIRAN